MKPEYIDIAIHLGSAWAAGSLIGLERSFRGRPAGFRTHALVCLASALLMMLTLYPGAWLPDIPVETIRADPTRMAQGIMTGIGFLGAGVIFKEGLSVRGLTTAASIWITAALGILFGVGMFYPALLATAAVLGTLAIFRWIEYRLPNQIYAHHLLRFPIDKTLSEAEVRRLLKEQGFTISNMSYRQVDAGKTFEYRMIIKTSVRADLTRLAERLRGLDNVLEFRIAPTGD